MAENTNGTTTYSLKDYKDTVWAIFHGSAGKLATKTDIARNMSDPARLSDTLQLLHNARADVGGEEEREWSLKVARYCHAVAAWAAGQTGDQRLDGLYWSYRLFEATSGDVDSYFLYLDRYREPERRFYEPRREKFLKFGVIGGMQDLVDRRLDLLAISMPPGTGKSTAGIYLLSGVMGWHPDEPNLASAHSGTLTRSFYDGVCQILDPQGEYAWHEIFPDVRYDRVGGSNSKDQTIDVGKAKRFKSLTCRAIGASLTGATRCERLLYADDLCSGIEEALSKPRLDKLWQEYAVDLKSRKKQGCGEIHIQTRWSVHDVVGRLQREYEGNPRARFVSVPALNAAGESNFDYSYGVGFDTKYFVDMKKSMNDDVSFRCLYMNEPVEREGLLYHDEDFRRYIGLPSGDPDAILGVCDTKDRGTDYCFMPIFYRYGDDYYWEDCVYENGPIELCDSLCAATLVKRQPHRVQFESNSAGGRTADEVLRRARQKGCRTQVTKKYTTQNKETKINVNSGWVKEHVLLKDQSTYDPSSAYGKAVGALFAYTVSGKNPTDDVPDGMAMFAEFAARLSGMSAPARVINSPI